MNYTILICGKKRNGKDAFANELMEYLDSAEIHEISHDIKLDTSRLLNTTAKQIDNLKDVGIVKLHAENEIFSEQSLRSFIIKLGNEIVKELGGKMVWCTKLLSRLYKNNKKFTLITGVRLLSEIEFFSKTLPKDHQLIIVKINRPEFTDPQPSNSITELEVDAIAPDFDLSIKDGQLKEAAKDFYNTLCKL